MLLAVICGLGLTTFWHCDTAHRGQTDPLSTGDSNLQISQISFGVRGKVVGIARKTSSGVPPTSLSAVFVTTRLTSDPYPTSVLKMFTEQFASIAR